MVILIYICNIFCYKIAPIYSLPLAHQLPVPYRNGARIGYPGGHNCNDLCYVHFLWAKICKHAVCAQQRVRCDYFENEISRGASIAGYSLNFVSLFCCYSEMYLGTGNFNRERIRAEY